MLTSFSKKLWNWLKHNFTDYFLVLVLFSTSLFVAFKNYKPGTFLFGWDDLVPELNFKLNISRSLSAVWQEYQGLGLLGGMGHAADLPRQTFLWIVSNFIRVSDIRYFWTFLMLTLGLIGVYFLIKKLLDSENSKKTNILFAGLAGGIFYLFNLATLQTFFTPFETFTSFFGFLPWLLYFAVSYLMSGEKKKLFTYSLISLLAVGAFYVQTLFVVYAFFLAILLIETTIKFGKTGILRSTNIGFVTLFINSFWLIPVIYFTITSGSIPGTSHINSIATPETQIMNIARSDFQNVASLKGYWFDYYDWDSNGNYSLLYKNWINHLSASYINQISLVIFAISILGILLSLLKKKTNFGVSFLALFTLSYYFLSGGTFSFIPFFNEIFRNSFTKWANAMALIMSIGLGYFVFAISDWSKKWLAYPLSIVSALIIIAGTVYITLPIANGELIAKSMEVNLPSYYSQTINYFKNIDPTKRIAMFPLTDFWGWQFNDWGYRGSGFLWYGIPQPILSRTFDVWSHYNEGFYNEINHALISANSDELRYVINKYQVSYIVFDSSIYQPGDQITEKRILDEKVFLESNAFISKEKEFGKITIYKANILDVSSFISTPDTSYDNPFISLGNVSDAPIIQENFSDSQGYKNAKNCNLDGRGEVSKEKIQGGNFYKAKDDGVSCDYFYYPTLSPVNAYKMVIKGKNLTGRSLKFYLYSVDANQTVIEELLPAGSFEKSYYLLPLRNSANAFQGYTLNVETRSFGSIASENEITGIEFYPVSFSTNSDSQKITNSLVVNKINKYDTWGYKVDTQNSGLIDLGQGFDNGWIAFELPVFDFQFSNIKDLTKAKILNHLKVDGWSNGWIVLPSSQEANNQATVFIVYWPQVLEFFGLFLAVASLMFLLTRYNKT